MLFTYFRPAAPDPKLDDREYAAEHAKQIVPTTVLDLPDVVAIAEWITLHDAPEGRKGDAGYVVAGAVPPGGTRKDGGPSPFCLIDYDNGAPDWAALDQYEGFAWTTASHSATHSAWRVLIPFVEPALHGALTCPFPGGIIRNRTQPAFLPTGPHVEYRDLEGSKRLDASALGRPADTFEARDESMLGAAFRAAGWVLGKQHNGLIVHCPWVHEHSDQKDSGTVVFHDDPSHSGAGKFDCSRTECKAKRRDSTQAIEVLRGIPAARAELDQWVEPTDILGSYTRTEAPVPSPVPSARFVEAPELAGFIPPTNWLVPRLELCPGRSPLLTADPSAGKTWSVQSMALSVASEREPVFGIFECRHGPVLHVSVDSGLNAVKYRYQQLALGMGLKLAELPVSVFPHAIRLVDKYGGFKPDGFKEIRGYAAKKGAVLVILDSLSAICAGLDENSTEIAAPMTDTKTDDAVWLWVHHNNRNGGFRGSSALRAAAGAMWSISGAGLEPRVWKNEKPSEEHVRGELEPFQTVWEPSGEGSRIRAEPVASKALVKPGNSGLTPEQTTDRIRQDVIGHLREHGPASANLLTSSVRGKAVRVREILQELTYEGVLVSDGRRYHLK